MLEISHSKYICHTTNALSQANSTALRSLRKYKTQVRANEPMDMAKFWRMIKQVAFNIGVVNFLMNNAGYFLGVYR